MRVVFAGTPEFALKMLSALMRSGHDIALVLSQPDRPAGRGLKLHPSAVKVFALEQGLSVVQPRSLRLDGKFAEDARAAQAALLAARPDVMVVASYGLLLPQWVLALPRRGCINVHASLLPRWRGAAPIQRAIEAGDATTGITIMQMDAGLDTGDILLAQSVPVLAADSAAALHERLAELGAALVVRALDELQQGVLRRVPQPNAGVTYAHKIDKAEAPIDWRGTAEAIARRIRAFDPFPGATCVLDGEVFKCWRAEVEVGGPTSGAAKPCVGEILSVGPAGVTAACGSGVLRLTELQRSGGKRLPAREFLQGQIMRPGMRFAVQGC